MKQNKLDKEFEKLEALSEGSVSDVEKVVKEDQLKEAAQEALEIEQMVRAKKSFSTYNRLLASFLYKGLKDLMSLPTGCNFKVAPTDKGVVFELKTPDAKLYRIAFKSTGIEKYDRAAVETTIIRAENTIDKWIKTHSSKNSQSLK